MLEMSHLIALQKLLSRNSFPEVTLGKRLECWARVIDPAKQIESAV